MNTRKDGGPLAAAGVALRQKTRRHEHGRRPVAARRRSNIDEEIELRNAADWQRAAAAAVVPVACWYLSTVLVAMGFTYGFYLLQRPATNAPYRSDLIGATIRNDGIWYFQIADQGYGYNPAARSNVAFFPVYPLVAGALKRIAGLRAEHALLLVSNGSFLAALIVLARYMRDRVPAGRDDLIGYSLATAALFPTGCFFRLPYSESTFLLISVLAMWTMAHRCALWIPAMLVGLATATRPVGVALLLLLAIHVWRGSAAPQPRIVRLGWAIPLGCWGMIAYMLYQYAAFGEPFAFAKTQRYWSFWPEVDMDTRLRALARLKPAGAVYEPASATFWANADLHGVPWFSLLFANPLFMGIAALLTAWGAYRRWLRPEEVGLCAGLLLIPYVTRGYEMSMASSGRFVSVAFPIYIVLAHLLRSLPTAVTGTILALLGFVLAAYSGMFAAGYWIY